MNHLVANEAMVKRHIVKLNDRNATLDFCYSETILKLYLGIYFRVLSKLV